MAVSDVLADSVARIREYLEGSMYGDIRPEIEDLLERMDSLRVLLDTSPRLLEKRAAQTRIWFEGACAKGFKREPLQDEAAGMERGAHLLALRNDFKLVRVAGGYTLMDLHTREVLDGTVSLDAVVAHFESIESAWEAVVAADLWTDGKRVLKGSDIAEQDRRAFARRALPPNRSGEK